MVLMMGLLALAGCSSDNESVMVDYTLTTNVTDETTGDPIEGAAVEVDGKKETTNANGLAQIDLSYGEYKVSVSADGYGNASAPVNISNSDSSLDIALSESSSEDSEGTSTTIVNFDEATAPEFRGFGGASGEIVEDPKDASNQVMKLIKPNTAETWAGVTVSTGLDDSIPAVPFTDTKTKVTVKVYSPEVGMPIRLKFEDASNSEITVEAEVNTTVANEWETLTFDFSNQAEGTAALDPSQTYNKISIFGNFGTSPSSEQIFYIDDIIFIDEEEPSDDTSTIVNFDESTAPKFTDFGGATGEIAEDPNDSSNQVMKLIKSAGAQTWAGVTVSTGADDSIPAVPFTDTKTKVTVKVYSPEVGMPIRLKFEDASNSEITVEAEVNTSVANEWETLTFDFSNQAEGTAALDPSQTYNKISIFGNFGTSPSSEQVFYIDDIVFIN
jgi:hypothetical protein